MRRLDAMWTVGVMAMVVGGELASGQTQDAFPTFQWAVRGRYLEQVGANAIDEGTCVGYFNEDPAGLNNHWAYSGGWVTELYGNNGAAKGTRFAIFQYNAAAPGPTAPVYSHRAYFPPQGTVIQPGDTYKAYAMTVTSAGDIYIVGEGPHTPGVAGNQDYIVVKYDKDLQPVWTGSGLGVGRYYNGTGNGNDIPAGIAWDSINAVVVVTGTSPSPSNGNDITTVAWHANGAPATDLWPAFPFDPTFPQPHAGARRWDNSAQHGNDRAAGLCIMTVSQPQGSTLAVAVLGTTYNGPIAKDDFTTHWWIEAIPAPVWNNFFDLGGNDTARGIQGAPDLGWLWCNGYSEIALADRPGGEGNDIDAPQPDVDYSIVSYLGDGNDRWSHYQDYLGGPDYAAPLVTQYVPGEGRAHIWITGEGRNASTKDAFTIHYVDDGTGVSGPDFTTGFRPGTHWASGAAVTLPTQAGIPVLPYITGAAAFNGSTDYMLLLKYKPNGAPLYTREFNRLYDNGGFDLGRAIFARQVDGAVTNVSMYIVGSSFAGGNNRDLTLWRYRR